MLSCFTRETHQNVQERPCAVFIPRQSSLLLRRCFVKLPLYSLSSYYRTATRSLTAGAIERSTFTPDHLSVWRLTLTCASFLLFSTTLRSSAVFASPLSLSY